MGWTFARITLPALLDELRSDYGMRDLIVKGTTVWGIADTREGTPVICCVLLDRHSSAGEIGWKVMDETMAPYYYGCPASLVDRVPDPRLGLSPKWREAWTKANRPAPQPAQTVGSFDFGGAFDGSTVTSDADPGL